MTPDPLSPAPDLLLTKDLLRKAKLGDDAALNALMARYLPRLHRWACGRLPAHARSLFDTSDLVQETLLKAVERLDTFEIQGAGGFQAYLRQVIQNRILDQVRWARRRAGSETITEDMPDRGRSPLEELIGTDLLERYEKGCAKLGKDDQLYLHLRIELECSYEEIADIMDRPTANSARMGVQRALYRLSEIMGNER